MKIKLVFNRRGARSCQVRTDAARFRQDAHESNNIQGQRLSCKWILRLQADKIETIAQHKLRFEWQLPEQCTTELCSRSTFSNDKRARRTHIHHIIVTQFPCEDAWTKCPVPANIDTSQENNERHTAIIQKTRIGGGSRTDRD